MDASLYNGLCLAYIGDAVFELYVRQYALNSSITKVNLLHKKVIEFTSGEAQAHALHKLLECNYLTEQEISYFKRGRNAHVHSSRKNIDLATYLDATGFESLIGYLYLNKEIDRLEQIINFVFDIH